MIPLYHFWLVELVFIRQGRDMDSDDLKLQRHPLYWFIRFSLGHYTFV